MCSDYIPGLPFEVPTVFDIRIPRIVSSATYGIPRTSVDVSQAPSAIALGLCTFMCTPDAAEYITSTSQSTGFRRVCAV
jgi:hypothetical protein